MESVAAPGVQQIRRIVDWLRRISSLNLSVLDHLGSDTYPNVLLNITRYLSRTAPPIKRMMTIAPIWLLV
jgi:hypothetical protein